MDQVVFVPLPEGIATMSAGAELAAALATVDPALVAPGETATLLAATRRQQSHSEALHARALRECALADHDAPEGRHDGYERHACGEPRAVLGESRTRIDAALTRADDAFLRLPALGAAWAAGDLDADRVRTFAQWTRALSDEHATEVVDTVLPETVLDAEGGGLTLSSLIERISEVAVALDPEWAARTYRHAVGQARVRARRTDAGTVNLSGLDLPLDDGSRSAAHVALLAARAKAAGHPGGIDTIRARIYLLQHLPRPAGFDDDALVAHAVATAQEAPSGRDPHAEPGPTADAPPEPEPEPDSEPQSEREPQREPEPEFEDELDDESERDFEPEPESDGPGQSDVPDETRGLRLPRQARIELRVALSTLLGLDDKPARMPGHGVLHAELARELAMSHSRGQWRVAVVDDSPDGGGTLSASLLTRRRPRGYVAGPPLPDGAPTPIVELHATEAELAALDPAAHPGWAAVLRDLQAQLRQWQRARVEDAAAREAERAAEAVDALDPELLRRVAERRRARAHEAVTRFPSAALRRWIEQRDRVCSFPPCGASATRCEIDHSLAVVAGGITVAGNLGPACTHDHDAKGPGGWTLHQPKPGRFLWTSPTGNHYPGRTPRIVPDLPAPLPPEQRGRSNPLPTEYADHGPLWHNDPYPGASSSPEPPASGSDEPDPDEPPF